ncbi:MAG: GIY-YIG nuclease family protein, partial [Candidatus Sulfopaludibacter sp.]|nr:GIY-YIG nuclease family protein [Candidatus Sulfopaludibacter sp.]
MKQHKTKEFWVSAIVFVSKDENLTKAHVRCLENRLLAESTQVNRFTLEQNQAGGSKLPESDREDMEVFLAHIRQLLPVLGSDILAPIAQTHGKAQPGGVLFCCRWRRKRVPKWRRSGPLPGEPFGVSLSLFSGALSGTARSPSRARR